MRGRRSYERWNVFSPSRGSCPVWDSLLGFFSFPGGSMQLGMYRALVQVGIADDVAENLVTAMEEEMDKRVDFGVNAIRGDIAALAGQVTSVKSEITRVDDRVGNLRWFLTSLVTIAALAVGVVMHFIH